MNCSSRGRWKGKRDERKRRKGDRKGKRMGRKVEKYERNEKNAMLKGRTMDKKAEGKRE